MSSAWKRLAKQQRTMIHGAEIVEQHLRRQVEEERRIASEWAERLLEQGEYMKALEWRLEAIEPLLTELVDNAKSTGRCHYCGAFGVHAIVHNPSCPIMRAKTLLRGEV